MLLGQNSDPDQRMKLITNYIYKTRKQSSISRTHLDLKHQNLEVGNMKNKH